MERRKISQYISKSLLQSGKGRLFYSVKDDPEDLGGFSLTAVVNADKSENGALSCAYVCRRLEELAAEITEKSASASFAELDSMLRGFLSSVDSELSYISRAKGKPFSAYAGLCLVVSNSVIAAVSGPVQCCVFSGGILRFLTPKEQDERPLGSGEAVVSSFDSVLSGPSSVLLCDSEAVRIPVQSIAAALSVPSDKSLSSAALEASRSGKDGKHLLICTAFQNGDAL